jgi:hypothetical protein
MTRRRRPEEKLMPPPPEPFLPRLKTALTGHPDTPLVFIGNFEVEDQWARGEPGLPRFSPASDPVVNRMDEFALTLAGKGDHVLLKAPPDPAYLAYLDSLGVTLPEILVPHRHDPAHSVTRDVLADPGLAATLATLAADGHRLYPHGVSALEEQLSAQTGLPLAAPSAATCKAVNSKIYSRHITRDLGLRLVPGWTCATAAELDVALAGAEALLARGCPVVIKDAFGVSGKGLAVIETQRRLDRMRRLLAGQARDGRIALVVEQWLPRHADLNYQVTVSRDGSAHFDFVKEALTERGVHKGHRFPATLPPGMGDELEDGARRIGARLAADGYYGVAGVDAIIDSGGLLYPVIEINARNNMSTYQARLQEAFAGPGRAVLVRQYPLRLTEPVPFGALRRILGSTLLDRPDGCGLLVNNFATVNAAAAAGGPFAGRLAGLIIADDFTQAERLDTEIAARTAEPGGWRDVR